MGAFLGAFIGWIMGEVSSSYGFFHDAYWLFGAIFGSIAGVTLCSAYANKITSTRFGGIFIFKYPYRYSGNEFSLCTLPIC